MLALPLALVACTTGATDVDVSLELDSTPALYEPVKVTVTVKAKAPDLSPVEVWLELPSSAVFINGQMRWKGDLLEGQTHQFNATIAFVRENSASLTAIARFPLPSTVDYIETEGVGTRVWVTETGDTPRPPDPPDAARVGQSSSFTSFDYPMDGSALLNLADKPRLFVLHDKSGFSGLDAEGLVPAEPWGRRRGRVFDAPGVLDSDFGENGVMVALSDRQRPTTGYHFAILRAWGGSAAKQTLGEPTAFRKGEEPPPGIESVILDIVSTAPRDDWPVEERPVSPYVVSFLSFPPAADSTRAEEIQLVFRVNGEIIDSQTVSLTGNGQSLTELTIPSFEEASIP